MKKSLLVGIALFWAGFSFAQDSTKTTPAPNIILLIGDGMGLSQVSSAYFYGEGEPNISRFKHIGLIKTSSSSDKITDSGAGATAFSTGAKSYNGSIGVGPDSTALPLITEVLSSNGYLTGLISTSQVTHATPASFFAHQESRDQEYEIASQLHTSPIDFIAGGGYKFFVKDSANYLDSLRANGFTVDTGDVVLPKAFGLENKFVYLSAPKALPRMLDGRGDYCTRALESCLTLFDLKDSNFFIMLEGSQIDWGGHANNAEYLITEMLDFDKVIGNALDYAQKDGNTLVIVVADHETGGFTLGALNTQDGQDYDSISPTFSTPGHSATLIPVFAYGPGAENFVGVYENNDIFWKILNQIITLNAELEME